MSKPARILAVDDNLRNLAILERSLARDFDLSKATSGEEALELAVSFRPDIILLDIMMPGIDGYETCRRLRTLPEVANTKIIMVSAKAMTAERIEGYAAGADDYIIKPFDEDEMMAKIRVYLRLKSVEELDRLKSNLLDLLQHETETPLAGISGGIALLRDSTELTDDQVEILEVAEASVERLKALVHRVCVITEIKAKDAAVIREPVDLRTLAAEAIGEADICGRKAVRVVLEASEAAVAMGDAGRLRWVVEALLDNALRFSPAGGTVTIKVGPGLCLSVSDEGPGIDDDQRARVFEEFILTESQVHRTGSGLSLATARRIAEHHDGALSVTSTPGAGSTFTLQFPPVAAALAA